MGRTKSVFYLLYHSLVALAAIYGTFVVVQDWLHWPNTVAYTASAVAFMAFIGASDFISILKIKARQRLRQISE